VEKQRQHLVGAQRLRIFLANVFPDSALRWRRWVHVHIAPLRCTRLRAMVRPTVSYHQGWPAHELEQPSAQERIDMDLYVCKAPGRWSLG
jgi:hypothetical protein